LSDHFNKHPVKITPEEVKDYLQYLSDSKQVSPSTINQAIGVYKILQSDILGKDWESIRIKRARPKKRLPVVFSKEEIASLVEMPNNLKHKAILSITYSSGLRLSEVMRLKVSDIDSGRMLVRINQGKGKKDRYTILANSTLDLLRIYYRKYRPKEVLFPGIDPDKPISARTIQFIFKRAMKKAGITKEAYFHCLRHSFATHLLEQGTNLKLIQQLMGHTTMRTTSTYLHVARLDSQSVVSPGDKLISDSDGNS